MPLTFSAATCITFNPGPQPATGPFNIYLTNDYDVPYNVTPIELNEISGNACPYIIEVPIGTDILYFKDIPSSYCFTTDVQANNICFNCDLGLSLYSATTNSRIIAGVLTGSCQTPIVDYKINWYGPDNTTTLSFSSGSGIYTSISDWGHPLTGIQSPPAVAGVYTPIIQNVIINGINYSNTGGNNTILTDFSSCLPSTTVLPLTCDYSTNTSTDPYYAKYSQHLQLDTLSPVIQNVTSTFKISASTKYIAWMFEGDQIPDKFTLWFSGASYGTTKIGLEDWLIGLNSPSQNFSPNVFPKTFVSNNFYSKITPLTGLTVNNNDNIIIEIKPQEANTKWDLYLNCLGDWDCDDCLLTSGPVKIIKSSITSVTGACNHNNITYSTSGCTNPNSLFNKWIGSIYNILGVIPHSNDLYFPNYSCSISDCYNTTPLCTTGSSITYYDKTFLTDGSDRGVFGFTGSSTFISTYYNSWTQIKQSCWASPSDTNLAYYAYITMMIPADSAPLTCFSDSGAIKNITVYLHPSSSVVSGITGSGQYYMKITANTITQNITFTSCNTYCQSYLTNHISNINISSKNVTSSYGTNNSFSTGIFYINPFFEFRNVIAGNYYNLESSTAGYFTTLTSSIDTIPFSGTPSNNPIPPYTLIPSLSGTVCNFSSTGVNGYYYGAKSNDHYRYYYTVTLSNPLDRRDFQIWAAPITNYVVDTTVANRILIYTFSGGTEQYYNPTYFI